MERKREKREEQRVFNGREEGIKVDDTSKGVEWRGVAAPYGKDQNLFFFAASDH